METRKRKPSLGIHRTVEYKGAKYALYEEEPIKGDLFYFSKGGQIDRVETITHLGQILGVSEVGLCWMENCYRAEFIENVKKVDLE